MEVHLWAMVSAGVVVARLSISFKDAPEEIAGEEDTVEAREDQIGNSYLLASKEMGLGTTSKGRRKM